MVDSPGNGERRLLAVHAHPDDESITTGGLLARCPEAGIRTCLVTCTDGRYGPVSPELGLTLAPEDLAGVRASELRAAAEVLGVAEVRQLGYHDSGMPGSPRNQARDSFWSQPYEVVVPRMAAIVREFRPHVVVTYDPFGCTGHPDHIQAHRVTLLGVEAAAEAQALPGPGSPWRVDQVLYPVFPLSALESFIAEDLRAGRQHPFGGQAAAEINYTRPDESVTHRVAIAGVYECKAQALHSHLTQVGSHYPQLYRAALARREHEHFRLAWHRGHLNSSASFQDVFEPTAR